MMYALVSLLHKKGHFVPHGHCLCSVKFVNRWEETFEEI